MTNFPASIGLERVQLEAWRVLRQQLNAELALIEAAWSVLDEEVAVLEGRPYESITLEPLADNDFHRGHHQSMMTAPMERLPALSVMAYRGVSNPMLGTDQTGGWQVSLFVEAIVKHEKVDPADYEAVAVAENRVTSRIDRMIDAVNNVIFSNPTLNGVIPGIDSEPMVIVTNIIQRKESKGHGLPWLIQGSRLEYGVGRPAALSPEVGSLTSRVASMSAGSWDQAP